MKGNDNKFYNVMTAKAATGIGNVLYVGDATSVHFFIATDGGGDAALTVQFQVASTEKAPNFAAAQSKTNQWEYTNVTDAEDGASIDGDTGIAAASADMYRKVYLNIEPGTTWVAANVTARTAGEVTVDATITTSN